jgi:hypothetical protein
MNGKDTAMNTERDLREAKQDQNRKHTPCNQSGLEDLNLQDILDLQDIEVENDPELAAIAAQLRETAPYAINPTFKEELRKELLQQFLEHFTEETN